MINQINSTPRPLDVGLRVADRFMRIDPPRETYMYHLGLNGLLDLYEATREARLLNFVLDHRRKQSGGGFDWNLYRVTGDTAWLEGARAAGEQWLAEPRRDVEGALLDPRGRYTIDIVSGLATVPIIYGHILDDSRFFDEAWLQLDVARGYLEDPATGLWYSRWGHGLHTHRPNPGLWGRGNGWLVNAWGRTMHLWNPAHPRYADALAVWQCYCRDNAAMQTGSGMFRQLMDRPCSFEETTATGLIGAGIAHGILGDTLPTELGAVAFRAAIGLAGIVDDDGNVHNPSTTAGGYNFERQYASCAIFNDPHGDGAVMGCCAAVHRLLEPGKAFDRTPPAETPIIVTEVIPGCVSFDQGVARPAAEVAAPVLARALALDALPALDAHGSVALGLLHWHDFSGDAAALAKAKALFTRSKESLEEVAHWRLAGEIAHVEKAPPPTELISFVKAYQARVARDREGLVLDAFGGYDIARLYHLLPLLGLAGEFDDACAQALGYQEWLLDPISGLWHAAYGRGAHGRRVTPGLWALGNAYAVAGVVDLLELLPRAHDRYPEMICLLRDHVKALHEWLPVYGGWPQLFTELRSFRDTAANGLLAYSIGMAVLRGWVRSAYYAAAWGGLYNLGILVGADGSYGFASRPDGGLDTLEAYRQHHVENDPYALGFILSGCAAAGLCAATGINYGAEDKRPGAR